MSGTVSRLARLGGLLRGPQRQLPALQKLQKLTFDSAVKLEPMSVPGIPLIGPVMRTEVPGPRARAQLEEYRMGWGGTGCASSFVTDLSQSHECFIADVDGNILLDCFGHIGSLALGYNHPDLIKSASSEEMISAQVNRSALGVLPPEGWAQMIENSLGRCAPQGLTKVQTMACGSCANENALKTAMIVQSQRRRQREGRGIDEFSEEELKSVMLNATPGAPDWAVLSFEGAFHGRTFGALSCTRSQEIHKLDIPQLDWPAAPFPQMKYPLELHVVENQAEIRRCLDRTREIIRQQNGRVAAMIIEPIQAEGGDRHAPANYFNALRNMAKEEGVIFIVDEVQTGCGVSGTFWAHEQWNLDTPPDIVSFAKKMQTGGFYYTDELQMTLPYRIFNTWMGDPAKLIQLKTILDVIDRDNLLETTRQAGEHILCGLNSLVDRYPHIVSNARGTGSLCAIDFNTTDERNDAFARLRNAGVLVGVCGKSSIRFRPALVFTPAHAEVMLERLETVVAAT